MGKKDTNLQIVSKEGNVITFPAEKKNLQFGEILREARNRKKLTQKEFAQIIGVSRHAIMNWEGNNSKPEHPLIPRICSVLGLTLEELYQTNLQFSRFERSFIHQLRFLHPSTQRFAFNIIKSMVEQEMAAHEQMLLDSYRIVDFRSGGLAAGTASSGIEIIEDPPTPFFIMNNEKTKDADAVIRVKGHSMEPVYQPEDLVYFEYTNVANVGDDLVVCWENNTFIKRLAANGSVYSLNDKYPFNYQGDGSDIQMLGRVLGVLDQDSLPSDNDLISLQELFREELKEYQRKHDGV